MRLEKSENFIIDSIYVAQIKALISGSHIADLHLFVFTYMQKAGLLMMWLRFYS